MDACSGSTLFNKILIPINQIEIAKAIGKSLTGIVICMTSKRIILRVVIGILAIISISISWQFAVTKYPTHSDVFWYGVIAGFLATLLLACLSLIGFLVYKLRTK